MAPARDAVDFHAASTEGAAVAPQHEGERRRLQRPSRRRLAFAAQAPNCASDRRRAGSSLSALSGGSLASMLPASRGAFACCAAATDAGRCSSPPSCFSETGVPGSSAGGGLQDDFFEQLSATSLGHQINAPSPRNSISWEMHLFIWRTEIAPAPSHARFTRKPRGPLSMWKPAFPMIASNTSLFLSFSLYRTSRTAEHRLL